MSQKMRHLLWITLLALMLSMVACGGQTTAPVVEEDVAPLAALEEEAPVVEEAVESEAVVEVEEEAPAAVEAPAADVNTFVANYLTDIPEGYMAVKLDGFKEILDTGEAVIIDLREPAEYEEGHVAGAVNIPLRTLADNLELVPADKPVVVYCASGHRAGMGTSALRLLGYDNVRSFAPGIKGWNAAEEPLSTDMVTGDTYAVPEIDPLLLDSVNNFLTTIPEGWLALKTVENLDEMVANGAMIIDVRQPSEFEAGAIEGAVNIPLRDLSTHLADLPQDQMIVVYCASGHRAALATSALQVAGFSNARSFPGGYPAWDAAMMAEAAPDMITLVGNYLTNIPEGFMALKVDAFAELLDSADPLVIDVREASEYAEGHVPGAINIPLRTLADNLELIPMDQPVVVYCASGHRAGMATTALQTIGYSNVRSFAPGWKGWTGAEMEVSTDAVEAAVFGMPEVDMAVAAEVNNFLANIPEGWLAVKTTDDLQGAVDAGAMLIDVREAAEFEAGHIDGAVNFPIRELSQHLTELPTDQLVIIYCASGHRAALSVGALQEMGFQNARSFPGGYPAWDAAQTG